MSRIKDYKFITVPMVEQENKTFEHSFSEIVNDFIKDGWQPFGAPIIKFEKLGVIEGIIFQAFVKYH